MYRITYSYWEIHDTGKYEVLDRKGKYYGDLVNGHIDSDNIKELNNRYIMLCMNNDLTKHTEIQFRGIEEV